MGVVAELRCYAFKDSNGALNVGWVRVPLGRRHPVTRVIEAGVVDENISQIRTTGESNPYPF
jgi:hypothetical protein